MSANLPAIAEALAEALHNAIRIIENRGGTDHIDTVRPVLEQARVALARIEETEYLWEIFDEEDLMVASGFHPDLPSCEREAGHYLALYEQDGPHRLCIKLQTTIMKVLSQTE